MDFNKKSFVNLCKAISESKIPTLTVYDFLSLKIDKIPQDCFVIRHDVDRSIKCALNTARIEHQYKIVGSYYFRYPYTFNVNVIKEINDLGHEVGYHYETLDKSNGNILDAAALFKSELKKFNDHFKVNTVAMHGNPLTKHDNKKIFSILSYESLDLTGEAYLSIENDISYFTDTGRTWNLNKNNLKDGYHKLVNDHNIDTTHELCKFINNSKRSIYINIHPERWRFNIFEWIIQYIKDSFFNFLKKIIRFCNEFQKIK